MGVDNGWEVIGTQRLGLYKRCALRRAKATDVIHAFQATDVNLQKRLRARGIRDCRVHHENLEHLQDHEHQWDQLRPGKRVGG